MTKSFARAAALGLLTLPAAAQISSTVGPPDVPAGCQVIVAISNDTSTDTSFGECSPYIVRKAGTKTVVFDLPCNPFVPIPLPAGSTTVVKWDTRDNFGKLVPPGDYTVEVQLPTGASEFRDITIGGSDASLAQVGVG